MSLGYDMSSISQLYNQRLVTVHKRGDGFRLFDLIEMTKAHGLCIAKSLTAGFGARFITAEDLPDYVAERVAQENSYTMPIVEVLDDNGKYICENGRTRTEQTVFFLTKRQLYAHRESLSHLNGIDFNCLLMLQPEVDTGTGIANFAYCYLEDYIKDVIIVDPKKEVIGIGTLLRGRSSVTRIRVDCPILTRIEFCFYEQNFTLQCLVLNCPKLRNIGDQFFRGVEALRMLITNSDQLDAESKLRVQTVQLILLIKPFFLKCTYDYLRSLGNPNLREIEFHGNI